MEQAIDISGKLKSKYAIAIYCLFAIIYIAIVGQRQGDFFIYLSASKDLFQGKDIFSLTYIDGYHYYYSLLFAILIYPFNYLPLLASQYLWMLLNAFLMWRIVKILGSYFKLAQLPVKQQWIFFALCCIFSAKFTLANIYCQQITICILYLTLQGLEYIFSDKKIWGAVLIAFAINIKLLPIVILPYLLYRREFIASVAILFAYATMLFLPVFIIGMSQNSFLLANWWRLINPANDEHVMDVSQRGFHSLTSFLSVLLVDKPPDKYELHLKRNIANLSLSQLSYVINIVRLGFVLFSFYFLRTRPFFNKVSKAHRYWEISYIFLITPLIFPHQQHYSFILAVPAMLHIFYYFLKNYKNMSKLKLRLIISALTISFFTVNATFLLGEFNAYYEHFKILTYGVLLLVPLLATFIPEMEVGENSA